VTLCYPLSYGPGAAPSKEDGGTLKVGGGRLFHARQGQHRDVGLVRRVSSLTIDPVRPTPPLQRHPRHCGSTGRQDAATLATVRLTASRQLHPRVSVRTTTKREISTPPPLKPPLDGHRARHDTPPEARFARTAVYSMILCAIPPHVVSTARHACKLPPLGLQKEGAVPLPRGGRW
jgi:hypothetical protein